MNDVYTCSMKEVTLCHHRTHLISFPLDLELPYELGEHPAHGGSSSGSI